MKPGDRDALSRIADLATPVAESACLEHAQHPSSSIVYRCVIESLIFAVLNGMLKIVPKDDWPEFFTTSLHGDRHE